MLNNEKTGYETNSFDASSIRRLMERVLRLASPLFSLIGIYDISYNCNTIGTEMVNMVTLS